MLAGLALAAACAAWHGDAAGHYPGVVMSDGMKLIDAWIEQAPDGRLRGRYVLHEPSREVAGTLDPVGDDGCNGRSTRRAIASTAPGAARRSTPRSCGTPARRSA